MASARVPLLKTLDTDVIQLIISGSDNTDQTLLASSFQAVKALLQGALSATYPAYSKCTLGRKVSPTQMEFRATKGSK